MIKKIGFKNIRVFKKFSEFEVNPLTILTGPNNSGKSTIQKILILLSSGLKINGDQVNLETLYFDKDFINKTGDFNSNVNYESKDKKLHFSFVYEDDIFGDIKVELQYEKEESSINATLTKIVFKNNYNILFSLSKNLKINEAFYQNKRQTSPNFNKANKTAWNWNKKELSQYNKLYYHNLLSLRNEALEKQELINNIDRKLCNETRGDISKLTLDEKKLYYYFKGKGITACDKRAIKANEEHENVYQEKKTMHNVWDENKNDFFKISEFDRELINLPFGNSDFLIHTTLLDVIGNDYEAFISNDSKKNAEIRQELIKANIFSYESFVDEYRKFEFYILEDLFHSWLKRTYDGSDIIMAKPIDTILAEREHVLSKIMFLDNNHFKPSLEAREKIVVGKILADHNMLISKKQENFIKQLNASIAGNDHRTEQDENYTSFEICSEFVSKKYVSPYTTLITSLNQFLSSIDINFYNKISKSHFLFGDNNSADSPFLEYGNRYFNQELNPKSIKFISKWLKNLNIADEFKIHEINISNSKITPTIGFYYTLLHKGIEVPLKDNGLGINRILLVLLKIVLAKKGSVFILEEPETNLHPAYQSKLADLFVDAYNTFKSKFIVETHSEYLIQKLQILVAANTRKQCLEEDSNNHMKINANDINIYYFYHPNKIPKGKKQVENMELRPDGLLKNEFGSGFFDESARLTMDLLKFQTQN